MAASANRVVFTALVSRSASAQEPEAQALHDDGTFRILSDSEQQAQVQVVFPLVTAVPISTFPDPVPEQLADYRPQYTALPDGSLLTDVYVNDLQSANSRLFGISALLMLFTINVWTCVKYIRRGNVKNKTLFYFMLLSQVLGPIAFAALLAPFFIPNTPCTIVNTIAVLATELSFAILISGISALKAYRCCNRSKIILMICWALQAGIFVLFGLDIPRIRSARRVTGSCDMAGTLRFIPLATLLTIAEALFLVLCFAYAVLKTTLHSAAQGRLSIALTEPPAQEEQYARRGWWDYVPEAPTTATTRNTRPQSPDSVVARIRNSFFFKRLTAVEPSPTIMTRKPSLPTDQPLSQPRRKRSMSSEKPRERIQDDPPPTARVTSLSPSITSNLSNRISPLQKVSPAPPQYEEQTKQIPSAVQMKAVIKEEMLSAVGILLSSVIVAVVTFFGSRRGQILYGTSEYLGANWALCSLLTMRCFSKVVRRHERDAVLELITPAFDRTGLGLGPAPRRRGALAHGPPSTITTSTVSRRRKLVRRSSWDFPSSSSVLHENASIRRKQGLKEWEEEKEQRLATQRSLEQLRKSPVNPFADFDEPVRPWERFDDKDAGGREWHNSHDIMQRPPSNSTAASSTHRSVSPFTRRRSSDVALPQPVAFLERRGSNPSSNLLSPLDTGQHWAGPPTTRRGAVVESTYPQHSQQHHHHQPIPPSSFHSRQHSTVTFQQPLAQTQQHHHHHRPPPPPPGNSTNPFRSATRTQDRAFSP